MNRRTNDQVLDALAEDFIPDRTDITAQILASLPKNDRVFSWQRTGRLAVIVVTLAVVALFASIPGAASAFRQWFGFLPGAGLIDGSAAVRVLKEPVLLERDGVTVTVEQVTALPDRTVIQYRVSGIPADAYPAHLPGSDAQGFQNACAMPAFIRLPDGTELTHTGYNALMGTMYVSEYETYFMLKPLPGNVSDFTLVMPCIEGTEREAVPEAWEFPLHLVPYAGDSALLPVSEPPTLTGQGQTPVGLTALSTETNAEPLPNYGVRLVVDKVVELPDGDLVYGSLRWDELALYSLVEPESYRLVDAQGHQIRITQVSPDLSQMPAPGSHLIPLAFKVSGPVLQPGKVTLTVDRLRAILPIKDAGFVLDTNAAQDENQQWPVNQDIQAGPYTIRAVSASRLDDGYQFTFQVGPEIGCVDVFIQGTNALKGTCGPGVTTAEFDGGIPTGKLTVIIANLDITLDGAWQAIWLPPEAAPSGE